jgi:hypothetical protein
MVRYSCWIFCFMLAAGFCRSEEKPIPYISPGIRIGYEFGNGFSFGAKVSIGISTDPEYYNITIGFQGFGHIESELSINNYYFVQIQAGYPKPDSWKGPFLGGAGAGIAVFKDQGAKRIRPILNLSYGGLLYLDADFVVLGGAKIKTDVGVLAVLPIPLRKYNFFDT